MKSYMPKAVAFDLVEQGLAARLTSLQVHLYSNDFTPSENMTTDDAQFEECDFSNYEAADIDLGQLYLAQGGSSALAEVSVQFNWDDPESGDPVNDVAYGYYVTDGDGDVVLAERFDSMATLNSTSTSVVARVKLQAILPSLGL